MSFIPGEGTTVPDIDSAIGSGIAITTSSGGVDFISTFLTAGGGIAITPSLVNKSVQISGVPGPSGVSVVQSGFGSGIEAVDVSGVVTLTGQYVAGPGLQMVPSGINKTVTIVNTGSVSSLYSQNGSGISITTDVSGTRVAANLTGGVGISVNPSGTNTSQTLVNTGVTSLVAGAGIGVSAATGGVTVSNTGVQTLQNQTGAVVLTSTGNTVTVTTPSPGTINLEAVQGGGGTLTGITAGSGIAVSGSAPAPTVSNTGVLSLTAGAGISLTGSTGAVTVSAIPPTPPAQWTLLKTESGAYPASGTGLGFFSTGNWPTNNAATLLIKFTFSNIVVLAPGPSPNLFSDTSIQSAGLNIYQLTSNDWLYPFYDTPQTPGIYRTFSYTYVTPAGIGGTAQNITVYAGPLFQSTWTTEFWLQY